jgi:hypothetical protein
VWRGGNVTQQIQATRASTSGTLSPSDSFPQSSYTRWTTTQYTECCLTASQRVYHTIPSSGEGSSGTNYDETVFGYDAMKRQNRRVTPGGTINRIVFDARANPWKMYTGTDDTGATDEVRQASAVWGPSYSYSASRYSYSYSTLPAATGCFRWINRVSIDTIRFKSHSRRREPVEYEYLCTEYEYESPDEHVVRRHGQCDQAIARRLESVYQVGLRRSRKEHEEIRGF